MQWAGYALSIAIVSWISANRSALCCLAIAAVAQARRLKIAAKADEARRMVALQTPARATGHATDRGGLIGACRLVEGARAAKGRLP